MEAASNSQYKSTSGPYPLGYSIDPAEDLDMTIQLPSTRLDSILSCFPRSQLAVRFDDS